MSGLLMSCRFSPMSCWFSESCHLGRMHGARGACPSNGSVPASRDLAVSVSCYLPLVHRTPGISCERPICSTLVCFIPLFGGLVALPSVVSQTRQCSSQTGCRDDGNATSARRHQEEAAAAHCLPHIRAVLSNEAVASLESEAFSATARTPRPPSLKGDQARASLNSEATSASVTPETALWGPELSDALMSCRFAPMSCCVSATCHLSRTHGA